MSDTTAVLGALRYLPATAGRLALEKVNPKFKNYFTSALAYGIDANRALDYLSERFQGASEQSHKNQLEQGAQSGTLRPDEMVSHSQMQQRELPLKVAKTGLSLATGGLVGSGPEEQTTPQEQAAPQQQDPMAILSQLAPKFTQFLSHPSHKNSGRTLDQILALAQLQPEMKKEFQSLEKKTGQPWFNFLMKLLGGEQNAEQLQQPQQQAQQVQPPQKTGQGGNTSQFMQMMQRANQQLDQLMGQNG